MGSANAAQAHDVGAGGTNGTPDVAVAGEGDFAPPGPVCDFEGCGRPQVAKGLCTGHYEQQRNGRPLAPLRKYVRGFGLCRLPLCDNPSRRDGLCEGHWARRRSGAPEWQAPLSRTRGGPRRGSRTLTGMRVPTHVHKVLDALGAARGIAPWEVASEVLVAWETAQRQRRTARGQEEALCEATAWTQRVDAWEDA